MKKDAFDPPQNKSTTLQGYFQIFSLQTPLPRLWSPLEIACLLLSKILLILSVQSSRKIKPLLPFVALCSFLVLYVTSCSGRA